MAAFAEEFSATISSSGKIITIVDQSNWDDNDENYNRSDFVRTFLLTDYAGQELDSITLPVDSDTTTYEITKDLWVNVLFSIVGAETFTKLQSYGFDRIYVNKLQTALLSNGCCGNKSSQNNINTSVSFWQAALGIEQSGNSASYQQDLDSANSFINQA